MNKGLSNDLKEAFPHTEKFPRPLVVYPSDQEPRKELKRKKKNKNFKSKSIQ